MVDIVTELNIYSSAVKFLTTRKDEAHAEYLRMKAHFEDASKPGLDPPRELQDMMSGTNKSN